MHAAGTEDRYHLHAYLLWNDGVGLRQSGLDAFRFMDVCPRVDTCQVPGSPKNIGAPRQAALHGLWYVTTMKDGSVKAATNFHPWVDYKPATAWLAGLWDRHKLSHTAFLGLSALFRSGHTKRKRDAEDVRRQEHAFAVKEHVLAETQALAKCDPLQEPKHMPQVDHFV